MVIVSQDRDFAIRFDNPEEQTLHTIANFQGPQIQDMKLMLDDYFLGTFESVNKALEEMQAITKKFWTDEEGSAVHQVSGFCRLSVFEEEEVQIMADSIRDNPDILDALMEDFD